MIMANSTNTTSIANIPNETNNNKWNAYDLKIVLVKNV